MDNETLKKLALAVLSVKKDFSVYQTIREMTSVPPFGLGYPSDNAVSNYYLGEHISREEIARVTKAVGSIGIEPENTRIRKKEENSVRIYEVLQASVETSDSFRTVHSDAPNEEIRIIPGDHAVELAKTCFQ